MSLSRHEQSLAVATLLVVAFGLLAFRLRDGLDAWSTRLDRLEALRRERAEARSLIEAGPQWREQYEKVRRDMPVFATGQQVDTHWLREMDNLARAHGVSITRRRPGTETLVGDVYELTIESEWEAPLDAFTHFLHAMQSAGAMLDVRELVIRTQSAKRGILRGSFTLHCAYMRGDAAEDATPEGSAPEPPAPADAGGDSRPSRPPVTSTDVVAMPAPSSPEASQP